MQKLVLGLLALAFCAPMALAQAPLPFYEVDVDGDGRVSYDELSAVWPGLTQSEFDDADVEGLGSITPSQLDSMQPMPPPGEPAAIMQYVPF
jgi:hypothetical protein